MTRQDLLIGSVVAAFSLLLVFNGHWFLDKTAKGQRLIRWFGPERGLWVLRGLASAGIVFGLLLANGIIRPIQW
jgi:hypothetical protein